MSGNCAADLILYNGKIVTVDKAFSIAEAVAVKDGKILSVGSYSEFRDLAGPETELVDLQGGMVLPGLYDSHLHLVNTGATLQILNCRTPPMKSIKQIGEAVADIARSLKPGAWILGRGWDQVKLSEHRFPTRRDLDAAAPDNPVYLTRTCGHLAVANSRALEIAGITRDTPQPVGGRIVKDERGEPTGMLEEGPAMNIVLRRIPPDSMERKVEHIRVACAEFNKVGLTSAVEAGITEDEMVAYQIARERGLLTVRVDTMLHAIQSSEPVEDSVRRIERFPMISGYGDDLLRFQGVKILIDGGIGGRTALLREPYEGDTEAYGILTVPEENLQRIVDASNRRGMLTGIHCAGGKAMDIVLEAYEKTDKIRPIKGRGFYLIHAYQPTEKNFEQCKRLGVNVASQPDFLYYLGDSYAENVGARVKDLKPHRSWIDRGILVAAGTDSPVTPFPPFPCLWAAVARRSEIRGADMGAAERVTREEAIRMYTINGAKLAAEDHAKGSLEPGKLADMIILDRDILTCPLDDVKDTRVLRTILGGKTVYEA